MPLSKTGAQGTSAVPFCTLAMECVSKPINRSKFQRHPPHVQSHAIQVAVYEEKSAVGGACTTQYPFEKAPGLGQSTGAYLLGLMPPELLTILDLHLPLMKRDPHYFLPTTGDRYLLLGSDPDASKAQFLKFFSRQDWAAHTALQSELEAIRTDIAPAMMAQPTSIEAAAERYIRPELKEKFVAMCRGSVKSYLERFGFESGLLVAMYAATDGLLALQGKIYIYIYSPSPFEDLN